jgi:hypothetical protein
VERERRSGAGRGAHLLRAVLGAFAFVLAVVLATAMPARAVPRLHADGEPTGGIGLRLTDAPASARDDPRARVYIVDHLAPGASITRHIEVSNTTASSQHIAVYPAAATLKDGAFVGEAGTTANELSTWTAVDPGAEDIAAAGTQTATVTIAIPTDAAPGERYGVIWAEARSDPGTGGGVTQVSRVGIRLYLSVGPGGAPAADFTIDSLTPSRSPEGHPVVSATVHNTGGRALDLGGTLQLADGPGGLSAGPFAAKVGSTLAIGDTRPVTITLDDRLPAGPWQAQVTLKSGLVEHSATASVTFPDTGSAPAVVVLSPAGGSPLAIGVVIAIGGAGVLTMVLRSRARSPRPRVATVPRS